MEILVRSHSGLRWIALGLLIYAIFNALRKKDFYAKSDRLVNMFAMVSLHIQLVIGLILYFTSSKVSFVDGWMGTSFFNDFSNHFGYNWTCKN
jgi:hypothetical protein